MTRVRMRVHPELSEDWKCERGRRPGTRMIKARGKVLIFEPDKHGFDYVSWASDNRDVLNDDYGWNKEWLVPLHDLWEAEEV